MTRTVVVTGGGTGIGKAVAAIFAAEGARVLITGRRVDVLRDTATSLGENVDALVCDATDLDQVEALRHHLSEPVDVLVNNAGGAVDFFAPPRPVTTCPPSPPTGRLISRPT